MALSEAIIATLHQRNKAMDVALIAQAIGRDSAEVERYVDGLQQQGLVVIEASSHAGSGQTVRLSPALKAS